MRCFQQNARTEIRTEIDKIGSCKIGFRVCNRFFAIQPKKVRTPTTEGVKPKNKIGCRNVFFIIFFTLQTKATDLVTFFDCNLQRLTTFRLENLTTEKVEIGFNFGFGISLDIF